MNFHDIYKAMREERIEILTKVLSVNELNESEKELVEAALKIAEQAYAPYSDFHVGAALRLSDGKIVTGSNQENAAYPSGLCAERTALFYAGAQFPDAIILDLAVVALRGDGSQAKLAAPCGGCRQVILESASRQGTPFRVLLAGPEEVTIIDDCRDLLPIGFDASAL